MNQYELLLECLKQYQLFRKKAVWNIYFNGLDYIKVLNSDTSLEDYGFIYKEIINVLNQIGKIKGLPKVLNIWQTDDWLIAYQIEKMNGVSIYDAVQNSPEPLKTFYDFLKSILPIINECEKYNMVFKDLITLGNVLYDKDTKEAGIIDIDGIQIGILSDRCTNIRVDFCSKYNELFENEKYKKIRTVWTTEMNIFSLYELFFKVVFDRSLLIWDKSEYLEEGLQERLSEMNISPSSNLYGRIMDLINIRVPNSIELEDFRLISENCSIDSTRTRLIN